MKNLSLSEQRVLRVLVVSVIAFAIALSGLSFNPQPANAASCAATAPLMTLPEKPRAAYIAANPFECKELCWFKPCVIGGGIGEQLLQQVGELAGQKLGELLQKALQGGGGGGGGGDSGGGSFTPPPGFSYDPDQALDDLTKDFSTDLSTEGFDDFFGPIDDQIDVTDIGEGIDDGGGTEADGDAADQVDDSKPGLSAQSYFCPNGDCGTIDVTGGGGVSEADRDASANQNGSNASGNNDAQSGNQTYTQNNLPSGPGNPEYTYDPNTGEVVTVKTTEPAGAAEDTSLINSLVQFLSPGDPDRIIRGDGEETTPGGIRPWSPTGRYGQGPGGSGIPFDGSGQDGEVILPGSSAYQDAFDWTPVEESEDLSEQVVRALARRWLQLTPFPIIILQPYLFE